MSEAEKKKTKFRKTARWKNFRKELKKKQKVDPITGSRLTTSAQCHHLCLKLEEYEVIGEDRQIMCNNLSHDIIHFFFGDENKRHDWRKRVENLVSILERMEALNS